MLLLLTLEGAAAVYFCGIEMRYQIPVFFSPVTTVDVFLGSITVPSFGTQPLFLVCIFGPFLMLCLQYFSSVLLDMFFYEVNSWLPQRLKLVYL